MIRSVNVQDYQSGIISHRRIYSERIINPAASSRTAFETLDLETEIIPLSADPGGGVFIRSDVQTSKANASTPCTVLCWSLPERFANYCRPPPSARSDLGHVIIQGDLIPLQIRAKPRQYRYDEIMQSVALEGSKLALYGDGFGPGPDSSDSSLWYASALLVDVCWMNGAMAFSMGLIKSLTNNYRQSNRFSESLLSSGD